jgi:isoleucyl-tRNA synthetase
MIVNNHRKHSSFALRHFIAGSCYTPDAAFCLLYAQGEQVELDVAAGEASLLEQKASELELQEKVASAASEADRLRAQAELIKLKAARKNFELNLEGAKRELQEINALLEELKPMCKHWDADILKMEQAMQQDEWAEELKARAENMLIANAIGIGYDHIATMRQHPDFSAKILPHIRKVGTQLALAQQTQDFKQVESVLTQTLLLGR